MEALYKRKRPHVCAAYNMDSLLSQVLMLRKVKPLRTYCDVTSRERHGQAYSEKWSSKISGHKKCPFLGMDFIAVLTRQTHYP